MPLSTRYLVLLAICALVSCTSLHGRESARPAATRGNDSVARPAISAPRPVVVSLPPGLKSPSAPPIPVASPVVGLVDSTPPVISNAPEGGRDTRVSYYARRFNGRRTSSGVRYDPEKLTAASNDYPLGSRILVINPHNQKKVVVTINDRCRKRSYPLIDLSRQAARTLGFLGKGLIRGVAVRLRSPVPEKRLQ